MENVLNSRGNRVAGLQPGSRISGKYLGFINGLARHETIAPASILNTVRPTETRLLLLLALGAVGALRASFQKVRWKPAILLHPEGARKRAFGNEQRSGTKT